jgi:hypothetical protein
MTPGEYQATLARASAAAGRSAEVGAMAAELIVIAEDLCSRARAERERARELASERLRRCHTGTVVQPSDASRSAAASAAPAIRGPRPVRRGV